MHENLPTGRFFFSRIFLYDTHGNDMSDNALDTVRERITALDSELLTLLSERRKLTNEVAETKIKHHIPVRDQKREEQLLVRLIKEGQNIGLDPHYVTQIFHVIIEDSVLNQQAMLAERANPGSTLPLNRV
ncbi:MAG: chorismate mutase, partial [Pseudomonadota bacterium]|nr:chorismate mutase [Pseudomonadota bacterium]